MNTLEFKSWYGGLPILAYGELDDEEVLASFQQILTWKNNHVFISSAEDTQYPIPDKLFTTWEYWLFLALLTECIEYGSSPRGAWLTDHGKQVLAVLTNIPHKLLLDDSYCSNGCCGEPITEQGLCPICKERIKELA